MKTAIPASTGAILLFIGLVMFITGYFIIKLSLYPDVMVQVIKTTNLSLATVFFAYAQMAISIGFMICGVFIMIISDRKADLPTQKMRPELIKQEFIQMGKIPLSKRLAWIFFGLEFISASLLVLIGRGIIPSSIFDIPVIASIFIFLIFGIIFERIKRNGTVAISNNL